MEKMLLTPDRGGHDAGYRAVEAVRADARWGGAVGADRRVPADRVDGSVRAGRPVARRGRRSALKAASAMVTRKAGKRGNGEGSIYQDSDGRWQRTTMDKLLLTPAEAAHVLGIGRSKLYELMRAEVVPSVRIGGCRRIASCDLGTAHQ